MALSNPAGGPYLGAYLVAVGDVVEVELRTAGHYPGDVGPRIVEGTIIDATAKVLAIQTTGLDRTTRVPWNAIAAIRDAVSITPHPAL